MERWLTHPPEKVWRALTEPAHFNQWYPIAVEMDLRIGGMIRALAEDGEEPGPDAVITELDPPHVFAFREGDDLLQWELKPDGDGCLLIFTHTFDDRPASASYAAGWHDCLDAMEMVLDGKPVDVASDSIAMHEEYVAAFGLDEGTAEVTPDGGRVRFERQLRQPVETVWAALNGSVVAGTAAPAIGGPPPHAALAETVRAGTITAVDAPSLLEYDWLGDDGQGGRVRWELSQGPGGARLVLTQTGPAELADDRSGALASWQTHIERLAKRLRAATA
jgi:uncharacterized protein YndB with AHSA1/START domain